MRPFPRAATLLLLISAAFFLVLPDATNAQIWVTSGFKVTPTTTLGVSGITFMPGNQTETAYCSTSAINPTLVQLSPAAADYSKFGAYCKLTPSTGAVIYSTECPPGSVYNSGSQPPATANPMGECDIVFQPQPGVTYTINSNHWLWPNMLPLSQCGFQDYRAYCLSDPLGYYSFNPGAADPFPTTPTYTGVSSYVSLLAINTVDDPCSVMGTCSPQNISDIYCTNYIIIGGLPICHSGGISVPDVWEIAHTSEPWTPKCSDVVQGSVTPVAYSSPLTDGPNAGATITATFTPNFGYTLAQAAQICGFTNFDWQQLITVLPLPNTFIAVGSGAQMYAPPGFLDPPPGGYTYELPDIDNAYPFYYNPNPGSTGQSELATYEPGGASGTQLLFSDGPKDSCLFGGRYAGTAACNWTSAAPGETVQFITHLVGINSDGTAHDLQIGFTWYSNNNGTSGGAAIMRGVQPMDPGSGTGGTTVTSVSETTNYQYPTAPGFTPSTLTFLDGSQVSVTGSGLAYSRVTKTFTGTLTIENISNNTIDGPFQIVLTSMPSGVALVNATGTTGGFPYITIPTVSSLEPGQSASVNIQISNPAGVLIDSIPLAYSGSFN